MFKIISILFLLIIFGFNPISAKYLCDEKTKGIIVKYADGLESSKTKFLKRKKHSLTNLYSYEKQNDCSSLKKLVRDLEKDPKVEYVEFDNPVYIQASDSFINSSGSWGQKYDDLWALKKINAKQAWDLTEGKDIVVALVDTGVDYNHPDLMDNVWVNTAKVKDRNQDGKINIHDLDLNNDGNISSAELSDDLIGYNFAEQTDNPNDDSGHGSHVAGILAAVKDNNIGIAGVAPQAKIMPLKAFGRDGLASLSTVIEAMNYAMDHGAQVINASWVTDSESQALQEIFQKAHDNNIVLIASAGNNDLELTHFGPASFDTTIAVAATTPHDTKASFSNYGPKIDIAAPGGGDFGDAPGDSVANILSTMPVNSIIGINRIDLEVVDQNNTSSEHSYYRFAGTSMAAPFVSGVSALLLAYKPGLSNEDIRIIIKQSADELSSTVLGAGRINAFKALQLAASYTTQNQIVTEAFDLDGNAKLSDYEIIYGIIKYNLESSGQIQADQEPQYDLNSDQVVNSSDASIIQSVLQSRFTSGLKLFTLVDSNFDKTLTGTEFQVALKSFKKARAISQQRKSQGLRIRAKDRIYDFNSDNKINSFDFALINSLGQII